MNKIEFTDRVKRLKDAFGEKTYTDARLDVLWDKIRFKSCVDFNIVIDNLISTERYAPLPNKIMQEMFSIERRFDSRKESFSKIDCDLCGGQGFYSRDLIRGGVSYSYAWKCDCENGKQYKHLTKYLEGEI